MTLKGSFGDFNLRVVFDESLWRPMIAAAASCLFNLGLAGERRVTSDFRARRIREAPTGATSIVHNYCIPHKRWLTVSLPIFSDEYCAL